MKVVFESYMKYLLHTGNEPKSALKLGIGCVGDIPYTDVHITETENTASIKRKIIEDLAQDKN